MREVERQPEAATAACAVHELSREEEVAMRVRPGLVLGLVCALALGCDELDGEPAPLCGEHGGCPPGTQCVDGFMCAAPPGSPIPPQSPRFELLPGGGVLPPRPPRQPPRDAGLDGGFDSGVSDAGLFDAGGFGAGFPDPGFPGTGFPGEPADRCVGAQALCTSGCANLLSDPNNCGACGIACPPGQLCNAGVCCGPANTVCNGTCVDTFTSRSNCGVCGFACDVGSTCVLGTCVPDDGLF